MMRKKNLLAVLSLMATLLQTSCGDDNPVTDISLSQQSINMIVGESLTLVATVYPSDADNPAIMWTSSNANVASVDQSGLVKAVAAGTCVVTCLATDGSGTKANCHVTVTGSVPDEHEYVDLGLPSGTLWATCNIGASSPEEYGDYFAWGETTTKSNYGWDTYKYCKGSERTITKYCLHNEYGYNCFTDGLPVLLPEDDAATANWGANWQMPGYEQITELYNNSHTTTTWTTQNGINGRKITSKGNGNSIFLPAAGWHGGASVSYDGEEGGYWSRSLDADRDRYGCYLAFDKNASGIEWDCGIRYFGYSVRPVRVQNTQLVTSIILSKTSLSLTIGATQTLTATIQPSNAANKKVAWTNSNSEIATLDKTGKLTAINVGTCTITCSAKDGSNVKAVCQVTVTKVRDTGFLACPDEHHPHAIDLGLPSGTKWGCCNVGASAPDDYGGYYAWGETTTKSDYNWDNYKYCNGSYNTMTKYCDEPKFGFADMRMELLPEDDAATANWGMNWQMPSLAQKRELYNSNYTTTEWMIVNGVNGIMITSKSNDSSIFLPAAGYRGKIPYYVLSRGYYWSRSLRSYNVSDAYTLNFGGGGEYSTRVTGQSVRPVRKL